MSLAEIVKCAIHPAIGVARVGNSPDEYFIGAELPGQIPQPDGGFKDGAGRIKRQAARFRLYGLGRDGQIVTELTAADAEIVWTVHLANKKGAWYCFQTALDIPGAQPTGRRNPDYSGDRNDLVIDPGPRSVSGPGAREECDTGKFMGQAVPLGELRTDAEGRLLVLGGFGQSGSVGNQPITGFDNSGWYDDTSDGPVTAEVRLGGRSLEVVPAWVIVAPPDYSPGIQSLVTMYDLVYEVATRQGLTPPAEVSFIAHVYPLLERFCRLQWVNEGHYLDYGWGAPESFLAPENLDRLASAAPEHRAYRESLFARFRSPDYLQAQPDALPHVYGDGISWPVDETNPRNWLTVTALQYEWLGRWARGDFQADLSTGRAAPQRLEEVPVGGRPAALDQAALENCCGGAFHPGAEASWPMRRAMLYSGPFRIKPLPAGAPERDYGDQLTPTAALAAGGPLDGSGPGDLTRWMSVPWQVDTASCGAGYQPEINVYLPTFWPARVPNQVLAEKHFRLALDAKLSVVQRLKYFGLRQDWLRDLTILLSYLDRVNQFITDWSKVGIVVRHENPTPDALIPAEVFIEVGNELEASPDDRFTQVNPWRHR